MFTCRGDEGLAGEFKMGERIIRWGGDLFFLLWVRIKDNDLCTNNTCIRNDNVIKFEIPYHLSCDDRDYDDNLYNQN